VSALTDPRPRKLKVLEGERLECAYDERFEPRFGPLRSVVAPWSSRFSAADDSWAAFQSTPGRKHRTAANDARMQDRFEMSVRHLDAGA
jgi:hypothetical protein